jgi:uncharacterized protein (TIGR04141 family)
VEPFDFGQIDRFDLVFPGGRRQQLADFTIEAVNDSLARRKRRLTATVLNTIRLAAVSSNGSDRANEPLRRWTVDEVTDGHKSWLLTLGRWFEVRQSRIERIQKQIRQIPVERDLKLIPWQRSWSEGQYNINAAEQLRDAVCLDTKLGRSAFGRTRVEHCDILLSDRTYIHVKRADSSQSLSHLFTQGAASALLLADQDEAFTADLRKHLATLAPGHPATYDPVPSRVVYAIGTTSPQPLPDSLFTIAKVALISQYRTIRRLRIPVTLVQIPMI